MKVLLEASARVNARDEDGATPHDTARDWMKRTRKSTEPYGEVLRMLIAHGARPGRKRCTSAPGSPIAGSQLPAATCSDVNPYLPRGHKGRLRESKRSFGAAWMSPQ